MFPIREWIAQNKLLAYGIGIVLVTVLVCFLIGGLEAVFGPKPQSVTTMPQQKAETTQGVKLAADKAFVPISDSQATHVSNKIREIVEEDKPPDQKVLVALADVNDKVQEIKQSKNYDFMIVTDKDHPTQDPNSLIEQAKKDEANRTKASTDSKLIDQKVQATSDAKGADSKDKSTDRQMANLNVYAIKAYPDKLTEISYSYRGVVEGAVLRKVEIGRIPLLMPKGGVGYMGPFIRYDTRNATVDGGIRIAF